MAILHAVWRLNRDAAVREIWEEVGDSRHASAILDRARKRCLEIRRRAVHDHAMARYLDLISVAADDEEGWAELRDDTSGWAQTRLMRIMLAPWLQPAPSLSPTAHPLLAATLQTGGWTPDDITTLLTGRPIRDFAMQTPFRGLIDNHRGRTYWDQRGWLPHVDANGFKKRLDTFLASHLARQPHSDLRMAEPDPVANAVRLAIAGLAAANTIHDLIVIFD